MACIDTLRCNSTSDGHDFLGRPHAPQLAKAIGLRDMYLQKPVFCVYTFLGVPGQRILLHLHKFKVGEYDERTRGCHRGFLRLWDGLNQAGRHPYPPNTLCGSYNSREVDIRKYTTGHSARLEFYVDQLLAQTKFKLTYQYISVDTLLNSSSLIQHDMHIGGKSVCDWRVSLDACDGGPCNVVSPGYPGIYPPNTECRYRIRGLSGTMTKITFISFNMVKSAGCQDHWLRVYAGSSASAPLVGQFCGEVWPEESSHITVPGHEVYMVFNSGLDRPPYAYNGFHAQIQSKNPVSAGHRQPGTLCDWSFNVSETSVSSPQHFLPPRSFCSYIFNIPQGRLLEVALTVHGLLPPCDDKIEIYQNKKQVDSICASRLEKKPHNFFYKLYGKYAIIRYYRISGQLGPSPKYGFWLSVRTKKDTRKPKVSAESAPYVTTTDSAPYPSRHTTLIFLAASCFLFLASS